MFADGRFSVRDEPARASICFAWPVPRAIRPICRTASQVWTPMSGTCSTSSRSPTAAISPRSRSIPETGAVTLDRYTAVDDFGTLINPLLTIGQVQGGVAQGIGQAMLEHTVYDPESGQMLSGSFMDYQLPRADGPARLSTSR